MAYLRFACRELDPRTGQPSGIFSVAYALLHADALTVAESEELGGHVGWAERHVPVPTRFSRKRNASHKRTHGLSWLKPSAGDAIARFYAIADILGRHGHDVDVKRSERPGYLVYEDHLQIVAEPFHGEGRR